MVNSKQDENHNEELKLSPLGIDEINSVISSFNNSTFNKEDLYKKDENKFVKKTLFDLAKESERTLSEKYQSKTDISKEDVNLEKKIDESQQILKEPDNNYNLDNTETLNDLDTNNEYKEIEAEEINASDDETIKLDKVVEEDVNGEHDKSEEVLKKNIDQDVKVTNEDTLDTNTAESNRFEYEEKTLEALDSVREAVTKSLEENNETQNEELKKNPDDLKIASSDVVSEINLINTLFKNIREISNDEIENIVKSKVIELAEGVIGYQIEKFPDKFLNKIKNSIKEIKSINNEVKIYLNEGDFEILKKFIDKNKTEINFKLDLDSSLGRGDFTIDMGGVIQSIKYKKVIE